MPLKKRIMMRKRVKVLPQRRQNRYDKDESYEEFNFDLSLKKRKYVLKSNINCKFKRQIH